MNEQDLLSTIQIQKDITDKEQNRCLHVYGKTKFTLKCIPTSETK